MQGMRSLFTIIFQTHPNFTGPFFQITGTRELFIDGDIRDKQMLDDVFAPLGFDGVITSLT